MGQHFTGALARPGFNSISTPAATATTPFALFLPTALLAHFVAQATPVFRRHIAPARRRPFFTAEFPILLPVFAHLLTHLAAFVWRQIAPMRLRPYVTHRAKQAQQQQGKGKTTFHGGK